MPGLGAMGGVSRQLRGEEELVEKRPASGVSVVGRLQRTQTHLLCGPRVTTFVPKRPLTCFRLGRSQVVPLVPERTYWGLVAVSHTQGRPVPKIHGSGTEEVAKELLFM